MYLQGAGVEQDYARAKSYFEKAYKNNYIKQFDLGEAATYLGIMYLEGKGTAKDIVKGRQLIAEGAVMKYPEALYRLGTMYQSGLGVPKDAAKAQDYFKQACERVHEDACRAVKAADNT